MTPTEARALADRLGNRARWHSAKGGDADGHWIENDAAKALRSLADQVEALQKVAEAAKRSVMNPAWSGICDEDVELERELISAGLLGHAREAT